MRLFILAVTHSCIVICYMSALSVLNGVNVMDFTVSITNMYLFKFNNRNTRKKYEIYSKLTIKLTIFIVDFEHISHLFAVFLLLSLSIYSFAQNKIKLSFNYELLIPPVSIYLFKVNNENTRTVWSDVNDVILMSLLFTLNVVLVFPLLPLNK